MNYRAAVASTDGKVVNQHFGRAERFHIIAVSEDGYSYLESREVKACCHGGEHEIESFSEVAEILKDTDAIIVSKVGKGAANFLEAKGFVVYEAPYPIDLLMNKIVQDKLWEADKWQYHMKN